MAESTAPAPVVARPRLTGGRVLVATILLALALVIGAWAWLMTYDPLKNGPFFSGPEDSTTLEWSSVKAFDETIYYVSAAEAGTFDLGFDVANNGRVPVTVEGLTSGGSFMSLASMTDYPTFEDPATRTRGRLVPFEPVTIDPGESRFLVLRYRVADTFVCGDSSGSALPADPTLRLKTLGVFPNESAVRPRFRVIMVCGDLPQSYDGF